MASLPSGQSATGLSAIGGLHSRYYWPMMKTDYNHRRRTASEIRITRITSWRSRERLTICSRHCEVKRAFSAKSGTPLKNEKPQLQRPIQISTTWFGNSSRFSVPGGKYLASHAPLL